MKGGFNAYVGLCSFLLFVVLIDVCFGCVSLGQVAMQVFLQYPNLTRVYGIELSQARYALGEAVSWKRCLVFWSHFFYDGCLITLRYQYIACLLNLIHCMGLWMVKDRSYKIGYHCLFHVHTSPFSFFPCVSFYMNPM